MDEIQKLATLPFDALQVEADDPGHGVQDEVGQGIHLIQIHFVAEIYEFVQMKIEGREQPAEARFVKTGLEDQGETARLELFDGVEADGEVVAGIDGAECIGADSPPPALPHQFEHLVLYFSSFLSGLGKTAGDENHPPDALCDAFLEDLRGLGIRNSDHGQVDALLDARDTRVNLYSEDLLFRWVYRIHPALVAELDLIADEMVTRPYGVVRGTYQGYAFRIEKLVEKMIGQVSHVPPPTARSRLSPCRISARNRSGIAKSQPISIANPCGRSIIERAKSKPAFSI